VPFPRPISLVEIPQPFDHPTGCTKSSTMASAPWRSVVEGEDVQDRPLLERKRSLRRLMSLIDSRLLNVDHLAARGRDFFRAAPSTPNGIVAKRGCGMLTSAY